MSVEPHLAQAKGSCRGGLMKHKINKLELQIGLEYWDGGGPQARPQAAPAARAVQAATPPGEASVWLQGKGPRGQGISELRLVWLGCS